MSTVTKRITTVSLEGEVKEVRFDREYPYFEVANMGSENVYISKFEDVTPGADGVYTVLPGTARVTNLMTNTVYVSGMGTAQITAKYEADPSFKSASKGGDTPAVDAYTKTESDMIFAKKTDTYTNTETDNLLSRKFNAEKVVATLPEIGETNTLYIVKDDMSYVYVMPTRAWQPLSNNQHVTVSSALELRDVASGKYMTCSVNDNLREVTFELFNADGTSVYSTKVAKHSTTNEIFLNTSRHYVLYYGYVDIVKYSDYGWSDSIEYSDSFSSGGWTKIDNAYTKAKSDELFAKKADIIGENLLINSDFRINQRGQTSYTGNGVYTVDRWRMGVSSLELGKTVTPTDNGVTIVTTAGAGRGFFMDYGQVFENKLPAGPYIISAKINGVVRTYTGQLDADGALFDGTFVLYQQSFSIRCKDADMNIEWVKLERGSAATSFVPPDPATELLKCQRYYQMRSTDNVSAVDLRPSMVGGVVPTVTAIQGGYAYSTEL